MAETPGGPEEGQGDGRRGGSPLDRRLSRLEARIETLSQDLDRMIVVVSELRDVIGDQLVRLARDVRRTNAVVDSFSASLDAQTAGLARRCDQLERELEAVRTDAAARAATERLDVVNDVLAQLGDALSRRQRRRLARRLEVADPG